MGGGGGGGGGRNKSIKLLFMNLLIVSESEIVFNFQLLDSVSDIFESQSIFMKVKTDT